MSTPKPRNIERHRANRRQRQAKRQAWREGHAPAAAAQPRVHRNATCPFCRTRPTDSGLVLELGGPGEEDIAIRVCRPCGETELPRLLAAHGPAGVRRIAEAGLAALATGTTPAPQRSEL
jgi:hypothetical protein